MLLIDAVTAYVDEQVTCTYRPLRDAWYSNADGDMPAWIGIEVMAQAVAAHVALDKRARNQPMCLGALLGSRHYSTSVASFAANSELVLQAQLEFRDDSGLAAYTCTIESAGQTIANATLKVFEPDNFEQFIATGRDSA